MPQLEHLEDDYLATRQATDLWQSAQLNGETVKLEATIPSTEPKPDIPGGTRSDAEIDAILTSQKAMPEKTVESPEVQAIRQQYKEHTGKFFSGETAMEEVGKAGRKLAEAVAPGIELAGRAIGLDEEGAAALSQGMVEFLAGLPGKEESDLHAGLETALAALPMVGMAMKGGKVVGKALFEPSAEWLAKHVSVPEQKSFKVTDRLPGEVVHSEGNITYTITDNKAGLSVEAWAQSDNDRFPHMMIGRMTFDKQGGKTVPSNIAVTPEFQRKGIASNMARIAKNARGDELDFSQTYEGLVSKSGVKFLDSLDIKKEFEKAVETLKSERGSVSLGGKAKGKEKLPGGGIETPVTWEEAIKIDEHHRAFDDRLKTFSERLSKQRRGVRSDVQVMSDSISPEALQMEAFLNLEPGTILKDSDVVAAKRMFKDIAEPVRQLAQWMQANPGDQKAMLALLEQLPKVDQGVTSIAGAYAESGRTQRLLSKDRPGVETVRLYRGGKIGKSGDFWTPDKATAEAYAGASGEVLSEQKHFANLLRSKTWMDAKQALGLAQSATMPQLIAKAASAGHDGLTFTGAHGQEYIVLKPATKSDAQERVRISDPYIQQWLAFFKEQDALAKTGAPALTQEKLIQALASMKTPEEFIAAAKVLAKPSKWDMFIEYWINGLLSGPATHATNMLSNAATIAWGIPERQLAAMFSKEVRPSEAGAMLYGILEAQGDAFRLAWQAFKAEESQMGLGKLEGPTRAITADALALTGVPGRAVDLLGSMIRLPGRALLASDDYFKSIAYRAELRALAKRESFKAVTEGGLTGQTARTRMREIEERILASPPEAIDEAAKEFASYVTFTRELGETGQKVQQLASTPVGRLVLPFVRTPTNIFKFAGERTPLAFASQAVRDEIAAGGQRTALALAKISLGAMTMSYMGMLASQGFITGGGPKDKALRAEMMMTGWQPYSFKIGDTYYRYARIEPLGSLIGMAADAADLMGQLPEHDAEQLASALVVAMSRNVANKTFLKGLAGTLNAVASQDIHIVKGFLEQELPTILPYSTAEGQIARFNDPVMREVNSILDAFKAKIPGLSDSLPARRNLWGEAIMLEGGLGPDLISPIYTTTKKLDPVANELVRLQMPIAMPSKNIEGVPLTGPTGPWEYDAYVVLAGGTPILQDMTLKDKLAEVMASDLYQRSSDGPDGGKKVLIQSWVSRYRDMARFILSDAERSRDYGYDFPDLRTKIQGERDKHATQFQAVP